jgi:hypothetical protein
VDDALDIIAPTEWNQHLLSISIGSIYGLTQASGDDHEPLKLILAREV